MTNVTNKIDQILIDAEGKALGRVASAAAVALRGKLRPDFERHLVAPVRVSVINASKMKLSAAKLQSERYARYSGYPGGLKFMTRQEVITKHGYSEPLRRAIRGMLPTNKLRPKILKHLTISE